MSRSSAGPLDIVLFLNTCGNDFQRKAFEHDLLPGFALAGDTARLSSDAYEPCDVAVISFSPRNHDQKSPERAQACRLVRDLHPQNLLIVESALLRDLPRKPGLDQNYRRFLFDHVHRRARLPDASFAPNRAQEIGLRPRPWRLDRAGPVVVAGQVADDYSLDGIDAAEWAANVVHYLRAQGRDVVYRPHPKTPGDDLARMPAGTQISDRPLEEDLDRAAWWVALTSGSAVDAVLAGVPTLTLSDANFAWPVAHHSLADLDHPRAFRRDAWSNRIANCQWSFSEIRAGLAWRALRPKVLRRNAPSPSPQSR